MIAHRNLGLVAAAATLLAAAPLSAIFERWTWLVQSTIAVAVVAAVAALTRLGRVPLWGQVLAMVAGLALALAWLFPSGSELLGVVPTPATFGHFGSLAEASMEDMRAYGVKVPDSDPLLFITVLGIGGVAVLVDLVAVGLRRPALAGLPMLAVYSVPVAVYVDSVPPVPFVIGAAGFLWLLVTDNVDRVRRFGRRFTGDGRGVDVWEASPLAAAGRRLAAVGVAVAVALPLAVPGMTGGLLDTLGSGTGGGTGRPGQGGSPGRIDLFAALSGQLNDREVADLVKVTTNEPAPFYLRFGTADELRPDGFRVRNPTGRPVTRELPGPTEPDRAGVERKRFRATVEVTKNLNMPYLPVYADPVRTEDLNGSWYYDPNLQVVFSNRENSRDRRYAFEYVRTTYTPAALRQARPLPADHSLRRQIVTPVVPAVDELVKTLVEGKRTEYDKVRAIYEYFSADNGFSYALSTEGGTSGQDIVNFLTNKVGFCQQYAAAMAWLVRAVGIPARVAFGFTNGANSGGGTYTLTNRNLHAWTEVYFDGFGWVPFDATPAYGVQGAARSVWAPDTDAPEEVSPEPGTTAGPAEPESTAGPDRRDEGQEEQVSGLPVDSGTPTRTAPGWLWSVAGALALVALLAVPALRRLALRRRRSGGRAAAPAPEGAGPDATGVPADGRRMVVLAGADRARADAHAAWDELLDTLVDFRVRIDWTETPRATADRLVRETLAEDTDATAAVRLLGRAEERARYARDPLTGEPLLPALRRVRATLAARADRRTRLLAAALPPSVLLHWRIATADRSARLVAAYGRLRYAALRWSPRRLLTGRLAR